MLVTLAAAGAAASLRWPWSTTTPQEIGHEPAASRARPPRRALPCAFLLALVVSAGGPAAAQYFGRNRVQWESFDWKTLKTAHFDIYYYPEEERAVRDAGR